MKPETTLAVLLFLCSCAMNGPEREAADQRCTDAGLFPVYVADRFQDRMECSETVPRKQIPRPSWPLSSAERRNIWQNPANCFSKPTTASVAGAIFAKLTNIG